MSNQGMRRNKQKAMDLYLAIIDKKHGVLPWTRSRW